MKYLKFQQDLLKDADARDCKNKFFNYPWFEDEHRIFICPQGYYFVVIPKFSFYLDKDKVLNTTPINGKSLLKDYDDLEMAIDTHIIRNIDEKMKLHKFTIDNESVFLDENKLKYFDLAHSTFRGINRISPIYIYENKVLVGMVLPVNYKEGE